MKIFWLYLNKFWGISKNVNTTGSHYAPNAASVFLFVWRILKEASLMIAMTVT
jgi:hypothetical protein